MIGKKTADEIAVEINKKGAAGIIIKNPSNIRYVTGYAGEGYIYVDGYGNIRLYVDGRYTERAEKDIKKNGIKVITVKEIFKDISQNIIESVKGNEKKGEGSGGKLKPSVIFDSPFFTYDEFKQFKKYFGSGIKLVPSGAILSKIRSVKSAEELLFIKNAVNIAETSIIASLRHILKTAGSGVAATSEIDMAVYYRKSLMDKKSAESFETIILSGSGSSMPHGVPSGKNIDAKGILLCDFGAEAGGYKSDETITVHLGKPGKRFLDVYQSVYSAQQIAISKIRPGISFKDIDKSAREYLDKKGYGKYFTHSLGHGVGLDIHEYPYVSFRNVDLVEEGMVFTIEPGVYISGEFGVRLEDMCYVSSDRADVITGINKKECRVSNII